MINTYHDESFLRTENDIAREVCATFWVECRRELVESGGVNHRVGEWAGRCVVPDCEAARPWYPTFHQHRGRAIKSHGVSPEAHKKKR